MIKNWCGTGSDPKNNKPTKFDKMIELMKQQIELQEQILTTLNSHHEDARKAWGKD